MGLRPWLSRMQIDYRLIVWWSSQWSWLKKKTSHDGVRRSINLKYTNPVWAWHLFTKMAVSPLILVRFEKFKILHAQHSGADLPKVSMTSRATRRARWRHARVIDLVTDLETHDVITMQQWRHALVEDDVWHWDHPVWVWLSSRLLCAISGTAW